MRRNELPNILFQEMKSIKNYPSSVTPVPQMINKTAFFPGGYGLWMEDSSDKLPSVLVLGQDFSTEQDYFRMLNNEISDLNCPTWRNLIKLFEQASVDMNDCFFSNVFMGLRKTKSMTGKFPGHGDKEFYARNVKFLKYQIRLIKPRTIITLGIYAAKMLADTTPYLAAWKHVKRFSDFNTNSTGVQRNIDFENHMTTCIALIHPSMRNLNVRHRYYKGLYGSEAEVQMIKDGLYSIFE